MTFKEARAIAREKAIRTRACIGRFKDGGWFVDETGGDNRDIYFVNKDGSLEPLLRAKKYLKKKK